MTAYKTSLSPDVIIAGYSFNNGFLNAGNDEDIILSVEDSDEFKSGLVWDVDNPPEEIKPWDVDPDYKHPGQLSDEVSEPPQDESVEPKSETPTVQLDSSIDTTVTSSSTDGLVRGTEKSM